MSKTYISLLSYFGYHVTSFMVGIKNSAKTTMMVPKLNELSYFYKNQSRCVSLLLATKPSQQYVCYDFVF